MKSKFEPDVELAVKLPTAARLIDPEAYDATEQRFAASVEEKPASPRFVPDAALDPQSDSITIDCDQAPAVLPHEENIELIPQDGAENDLSLHQADVLPPPDSGSWRGEVAARVNNYRARRRPREPRYPSLQLKFDSPQPAWSSQTAATAVSSSQFAVAVQETYLAPREAVSPRIGAEGPYDPMSAAEAGAKILEFPRSSAPPAPILDELAEPVMDRPRILEVPELLLPPPALGGILMEAAEEPPRERRPGFELPLQAAPMSRRLLAGGIDSLLVTSAFAVFAYIFFRVTSTLPAPRQAAGIAGMLIALFWAAYQYLLIVYTGTTPGLKLARLRLSQFDGAAVPRKIRRWRVLASILSGLSLALGYAWCFLDEDQLCWHDRITRTYMAPQSSMSNHRASHLI